MNMTATLENVEKVRNALEARNYKMFAECFAPDGVYERPYALKGTIDRYEGADKIYAYIEAGMAAANKLFDIVGLEVEIHPCVKEHVVFVEFFLSGKSMATAESFRIASSAALIEVKEGKIVKYRDFPNSAGIAQAAGTLAQFASSLAKLA
jgi:uncharacterized protein